MNHKREPVELGGKVPSGTLLQRGEVAALLGKSVSTVRRMEGSVLTPHVDAAGVHLFDKEQVLAAAETLGRRPGVRRDGDGEVAAEVFELLDEGVHAVDIVKQLRLAPKVVLALQSQWAQMREAFYVGLAQAKSLASLTNAPPASDAKAMIESISALVGIWRAERAIAGRCQYCGGKEACVCKACVVARRGAVGARSVRLERSDEGGSARVRVVFETYWDDTLPADGFSAAMATVRSDWYALEGIERSGIGAIVSHLDARPLHARETEARG